MARVKNRRDVPAMIGFAREQARETGATQYLVPTYYGLDLDSHPAIAGRCYRIEPSGEVWLHPDRVEQRLKGAEPKLVHPAGR